MSNRIGFIGAGNMGGAMITSIAQSGIIPAENIWFLMSTGTSFPY